MATIIGSVFHEDIEQAMSSGLPRGEIPLRLEPDGEVTATLIWDKEACRAQTYPVAFKVRLLDGAEQVPLGLQVLDKYGTFLIGQCFVPAQDWAGFGFLLWQNLKYRGCYQWDFTDGDVDLN